MVEEWKYDDIARIVNQQIIDLDIQTRIDVQLIEHRKFVGGGGGNGGNNRGKKEEQPMRLRPMRRKRKSLQIWRKHYLMHKMQLSKR